jgi:hypothetical protein
MLKAAYKHPASLVPYIALTRDSAKNIMWPVFAELKQKHGLDYEMLEGNLNIKLPNQSRIILLGADLKNFVERLRGIKTPFAGIDEGQAFGSHLGYLIDDILTPAIADYADGAIALTGTPGPVPKGPFFDATMGRSGFSVHRWSILDNPYMPDAKGFIERERQRKGYTDSHPTYRREWLGEWVSDPDSLVYKFGEERNTIERLPDAEYQYVLGVDLGYSPDPSAFVLCCYSRHDPTLYIVETYKQNEMIISDVAERIAHTLKRHPLCQVVIDAANKQAVEEMRQRYRLPIQAADKQGKSGFIELMNSDFHAGRIKTLQSQCAPLIDEWMTLPWDFDTSPRREHPSYGNHLTDAALYAWRYCYNYAWTQFEKKTEPTSEQAVDSFWEREEAMTEQKKHRSWLDEI